MTMRNAMRTLGVLIIIVVAVTGGFAISPIFTVGLAGLETAAILVFMASAITGVVALAKLVLPAR